MQIDLDKYIKKDVEHFPHQMQNIKPLVSVCVQTYNHANFIRECLDGIISQKTNFPIEVLLGEDESDDGTREICIEYAERCPEKIRLFLHRRENVIYINDRATGRFNLLYNLQKARGKYLALCEGDDYWTNSHKIQRQIDFLEANSDYVISFHQANILQNNVLKPDTLTVPSDTTKLFDLINKNYIRTCSVVMRNSFKGHLPDFYTNCAVGDYVLYLLHAQYGKIKYFAENMAVYRIHHNNTWVNRDPISLEENWVDMQHLLFDYFNSKDTAVASLIKKNQEKRLYNICQYYYKNSNRKKLFEYQKRLIKQNPYYFFDLLFEKEHILDSLVQNKTFRLRKLFLKKKNN
jgi:glycosyltransferase involved in cell wall biosynthesis